jgi:hypothetical protein
VGNGREHQQVSEEEGRSEKERKEPGCLPRGVSQPVGLRQEGRAKPLRLHSLPLSLLPCSSSLFAPVAVGRCFCQSLLHQMK